MSAARCIAEARRLLSIGWSRHLPAVRMEAGDPVVCDWNHPEAFAFDVYSALFRASKGSAVATCEALSLLDAVSPGGCFPVWADAKGRKKPELLEVMGVAAARASRIEQEAAPFHSTEDGNG